MIQAVADGQFDMAADGITITEERAEIVDFSDGYINVDQRLMVRMGEDRFNDGASFAAGDFVLGTQIGTSNYDTGVELVGGDRVQPFEEFGFVVQSLIVGDVDAVIIDETAGQGYIGENADQVDLIGGSLSSDQLGFIFPKGGKWVEPINEALADMKADGTLETISSRYFGGAFTITFDDLEFPEYDGEQPQPSTSVGVHLGAAVLEHAVLDAPAVGRAHHQVVIRGGPDLAAADQGQDPELQLHPVRRLVHIDVGHRVGAGVLCLVGHEIPDRRQARQPWRTQIGQVEHGVVGEDGSQPVQSRSSMMSP